jgi:hypothetical protein
VGSLRCLTLPMVIFCVKTERSTSRRCVCWMLLMVPSYAAGPKVTCRVIEHGEGSDKSLATPR